MQEFAGARVGQIGIGVFAIIIILIVLGVVAARRASKRRTENLREWALRHGYSFTPGPMPARDLAPLSLFEIKDDTTAANARNVASSIGMRLFDFDHTERSSIGHETRYKTTTKSCALFELAEPLPRFAFVAATTADPDSLLGKMMAATVSLARAVGGPPGEVISIADRPGFVLKTEDEPDRVRRLFANAHYFDDKCGWEVQSNGSWMLLSCNPKLYQHGWEPLSIVSPKNHDEFVNLARQIHDYFRRSSSQ